MSLRYRLALDLGPSSLGWAVLVLNDTNQVKAIVAAGSRIFPDGRNPKDGSSLAVTRRLARALRRRRDRLLHRKGKLLDALVRYGFFPEDIRERKALELLDPYELRAKGLDQVLAPYEFGRALFHLNQRRGFKSNRKTDSRENDSSVMKGAIRKVREILANGDFRTVGEWLHRRKQNGETVRARFRQQRVAGESAKMKIEKWYDLYVDRAMIEEEFDALWRKQAQLNPDLFQEEVCAQLKDILLYQRKLKPVNPGRCTFLSDEQRAPRALPSVQRFRIYQEVNHLRWLDDQLREQCLSIKQRDAVVRALDQNAKRSFQQIRTLLGMGGGATFNIEDAKRQELKGNATNVTLSRKQHFGPDWYAFSLQRQDDIVNRLLTEEDESVLIAWLQKETGIDENRAKVVANASLVDGYASLSRKAIDLILPQLQSEVRTYDVAVQAAGFAHHSNMGARAAGEILPELPYYGKVLQRYVGFGTGVVTDTEEKRYGRIANPSVHIGLNQVRVVINELIHRYGLPSQIVVELARDLKLNQEQKRETERRQADNQKRNDRCRREIAEMLGIDENQVKRGLIQKMILWEELSFDPTERRCPYTGVQISLAMLLGDEVEIEHILPFSRTLDDSLNNKTVSLRKANRVKGNSTPWEAFGATDIAGFDYEDILARAQHMPRQKRYRFAPDGYERWLKDEKGFLARALNDTSYLSRVAKEYLTLICPQGTWAVPGKLTGLLRGQFGLNNADILGWSGKKNREDHRHHAVDACVIGVTDRSMLRKLSSANASARGKLLGKLVESMPVPWPTYREQVKRAVNNIWVSHKPDHGYEKAMHDATAYGLMEDGRVRVHKDVDGVRTEVVENLDVIPIASVKAGDRHGYLRDGSPKPYKGYKGNSNYCIEIVRAESGRWTGEVVSTFQAYQVVREYGATDGWRRLRNKQQGLSGKPLALRLMINDVIRFEEDGIRTMRVVKIASNGQITLADIHEANVDARNRNKEDSFSYISKMAGALQKTKGRRVTISPAGRLCDSGVL